MYKKKFTTLILCSKEEFSQIQIFQAGQTSHKIVKNKKYSNYRVQVKRNGLKSITWHEAKLGFAFAVELFT